MAKKKEALLKKRAELLEKVIYYGDFISGSLSRISRNGTRISGYNLTSKDDHQKTITKYVSQKQRRQAQRGIQKMEKVRKLIRKISQINLELLGQG